MTIIMTLNLGITFEILEYLYLKIIIIKIILKILRYRIFQMQVRKKEINMKLTSNHSVHFSENRFLITTFFVIAIPSMFKIA